MIVSYSQIYSLNDGYVSRLDLFPIDLLALSGKTVICILVSTANGKNRRRKPIGRTLVS